MIDYFIIGSNSFSSSFFINFLLKKNNVETRRFYPNFDKVKYMNIKKEKFPNSRIYENSSLYLPSGPNLKLKEIKKTVKLINNFYN